MPPTSPLLKSLCLSALLLASPTLAQEAEPDGLTLASGEMALSQLVGRTVFAATEGGSLPWNFYLSPTQKAHFVYSSGSERDGTWRMAKPDVICFAGLVDDNPAEEVCKQARRLGRGLDWLTVVPNAKGAYVPEPKGATRGTSQLLFSYAGHVLPSRERAPEALADWKGRVVLARTLKDREPWLLDLGADGTASYLGLSGAPQPGSYTIEGDKICLDLPADKKHSGCFTAPSDDKHRLWQPEQGKAVSEIVATVPRAIDGPYPLAGGGLDGHWLVGAPGARYAVLASQKPDRISVIDTRRGEVIGTREMAYPYDIELSAKGDRVVLTTGTGGAEIYSLPTLKLIAAVQRPAGLIKFTEPMLVGDDTLAVGDEAGKVHFFDARTGAAQRVASTMAASTIVDLKLLANGRLVVAHEFGLLEILKNEGETGATTSVDLGEKPLLLQPMPDGSVTISTKTRVARWDPATNTLTSSDNMGSWGLSGIMPDGTASLLVSPENKLVWLAYPSLQQRREWPLGAGGIARTLPALSADGAASPGAVLMTYAPSEDKPFVLGLWALDLAAFRKLEAEPTTTYDPVFRRAQSDFETVQEAALSDAAKAKRAYEGEDCKTYNDLLPGLALADRISRSCEEAREAKQAKREFDKFISNHECAKAGPLAQQYGFDTALVQRCEAEQAKIERKSRFDAALARGDCAAVAELTAEFGNRDTSADCELRAAMALDNARAAYLAAVRFDTSKDRKRARALYEHILKTFPQDDVAIEAAGRLTALADLEALEASQAEQAAALKAAEERAAAAERAAAEASRRAAEEQAERQRAQAAAEADARAQQDRDTACDHVYVGKTYQRPGGALRIMQTYEVVGVSPRSHQVTVRSRDFGWTGELSCYDIPY